MALPLIPLLLGGLFAGDKFKRGRDSKARTVERDRLKEGMLAALGTEPSLFEGEARPGGEQLQGQFGGTGLLADPNNQANQLQFGADLFGANLRNASLANITGWEHIKSIKYANVYGVMNNPKGFVEWATAPEQGAVSIENDDEWKKFVSEKKQQEVEYGRRNQKKGR